MPHDRRGRKTYKYALTVVDVASRYKEAEPLSTKESAEVAKAFSTIYKRSRLKWPKLLQVDPGREFMGAVNKLMNSKNVKIRRGEKALHRSQAIVERSNRTLAEKLFGHQYAQEYLSADDKRSREWVARLPDVINSLNKESTRLTGKTPLEAIKPPEVKHLSSSKSRPESLLPRGVKVRYLYQPGELEGGERRRATDPIWSLDFYEIRQVMPHSQPIIYYLHHGTNSPAPKRGFVRSGTETNRQCFADICKSRQSQFGSKSRIYCLIDALKTMNTAQRHLDNKHRQLILPICTRFIANLTLQTLPDICKALPISLCAAP